MVHRQQHQVVLLGQSNQSRTDQRSVRQVEGALPLVMRQEARFTLADFFRQGTQVDDGSGHRRRRRNDLAWLPVLLTKSSAE